MKKFNHHNSNTVEEFQKANELPTRAIELLDPMPEKPVRLLGISVSNLNVKESKSTKGQLTLNF